jgi:hypothetical protein
MKVLEVDLVLESGAEYTKEFKGEWIISPFEEYQFESKNGDEIPMQGLCCAVALTSDEKFLLYTFHKNYVRDPFLEEFDSLEDLDNELSDMIMIDVKARLNK